MKIKVPEGVLEAAMSCTIKPRSAGAALDRKPVCVRRDFERSHH